MSDPQDLLYTNQFISTDVITDKQLEDETRYYYRLNRYINETTPTETDDFIKEDKNETDLINLNKISNTKWPVYTNRNHYPLFDSFIKDVSENSYEKEIITKINIDSRNRDYAKYLFPNDFEIPFNTELNDVHKIVIEDIVFPNSINSITNYSNALAWQYAASFSLSGNNLSSDIIPTPDPTRKIYYTNLPYSTYSSTTITDTILIDNSLVYQTSVLPSFYTVQELQQTIRNQASHIPHPEKGDIIEEPYYSFPKIRGSPTLFTLNINPITSIVQFVNRIEEVRIVALQTFEPYENNYPGNDIFYNYTDTPYTKLDPNYIYITLPYSYNETAEYYPNPTNLISPSPFPLVITGLSSSIGNIDFDTINYTEFYDLTLYIKDNLYKESEIDSVSTYKYVDTITITSGGLTKKFIRFAFKLSTGNLSGNNYNINGKKLTPIITQTILYSNSLANFFQNTLYDFQYNSTDPVPLVGRALLFRWIYDIDAGSYVNYEVLTNDIKKRSLLHYLVFPIADRTNGNLVMAFNNGFRFVHMNTQSRLFNSSTDNTFGLRFENLPDNNRKLDLQAVGNDFYFITNHYVFIKILFDTNETIRSQDRMINGIDGQLLQYNQNYLFEPYFDTGIGNNYSCVPDYNFYKLYSKDQDDIYTKIMLSNIPGAIDIQTSNTTKNNYAINYTSTFSNISKAVIQIYDANLLLLNLTQDFSFTLNIFSNQSTLKETLISTKSGSVNTTGAVV
jgi:hypothetical protein